MENKIASFEEFKKRAANVTEENAEVTNTEHQKEGHDHDGHEHYMFFQNLASIKHHIEEILKMNPEQIDALLKNGHDWASDHIATSKDDIQEVAEWLRNETEEGHDEEEEVETSVVIETPEGEEEVEDEESEDEDEDEDEEEEESEEEESEEEEG